MRIVFDLQACQSPSSFNRGIGRYTLAHVRAFIEVATEHEVILVLNNNFADAVERVRESFVDILDACQIRVFSALGQLGDFSDGTRWRHAASQELYEDFIRNLQPDVFHVTSLFEGINDAVTGIVPNLPGINSVTLYDLIPYQYAARYLPLENHQDWYLKKLQAVKSADLVLAISESSRRETIELVGVSEQGIVNISSAIGEHFQPLVVPAPRQRALRDKYGLASGFILYTGGIDFRKNIEGLIRAYALLPGSLRELHPLAVVCGCEPATRERLDALAASVGIPSGQFVMTGYVSEQELVDLYNLASLFVFPSLHEGFGLPVLEAMACGVPTLVSNTSSLPELVNRADMQFDPHDHDAICAAMRIALANPARMADLREHGLMQARRFSWRRTAEATLEAFERAFAAKSERAERVPLPSDCEVVTGHAPRPRLAYVSPLPPEQSGIADYSAMLLPELARYYEIEVITPQAVISDPWVRGNFPARTPQWLLDNVGRYDRVLYHFGNNMLHRHMFDLLKRIPGTVVLHDFFLSDLLSHLQATGEVPDGFTRSLFSSHGYRALSILQQSPADAIARYPASYPVVRAAQGVIVHSEYSLALARQHYGPLTSSQWCRLPMLRAAKRLVENTVAKGALGLPSNSQVTASVGFLGPTKLNLELIDAWLATQQDNPDAWLVLVGRIPDTDYGSQVTQRIAQSPAHARIRVTGFVDSLEYDLWLAAADVTVQLRAGSRGETSAAVHDCINAGKPLIFNASGSNAELPESVGVRLPGDVTVERLACELGSLLRDPVRARGLGSAALTHSEQLAPAKVARLYQQAIERFASTHPLARRKHLLKRLHALPELALQSPGNVAELACAVTRNLSGTERPTCYIDTSALARRWSAPVERALRGVLLNPPDGWRVELVALRSDGYVVAHDVACGLLGLESMEAEPLLTCAGDAWVHVDQVRAPASHHAWLKRTTLVRPQQLQWLNAKALGLWLDGHPLNLIEA